MTRKRDGRRVSGHPGRSRGRDASKGEAGYGEAVEDFNRRLRRDRVLGTSGLVVSVVVLLLNLAMEVDAGLRLLPGGHSELYFLAAVTVAGASAWVAFDLGNKRRIRR